MTTPLADGGEDTGVLVLVAAHDEQLLIGATLSALREAFPAARLWVADDGSRDTTAAIARAAGAAVVTTERRLGKGGAMTAALREALDKEPVGADSVVLLCDGDLGACAARLVALVSALQNGDADLAVASFADRAGGGFGILVGFAKWAIARRCGLHAKAPLCGQRAFRATDAHRLLPFAPGYGLELAMTIDAARAGLRVEEIELDLTHRVTGRTPAGFAHRARQLLDCLRAYMARR